MKHVDVARQLLALEGAGPEAALRVHARLAARLEPLIGVAGTRALLARSARLTAREHACFASLAVAPAGSTETIETRLRICLGEHEHEPAALAAAAAALCGTMLGLLTSFIGEPLVWQVLRGAFPAIEQSVEETEP